jgi:hypothetical protein
VRHRARGSLDPLAPGADLGGTVDDHDPGVLLDLMVAEFLAGVDLDEDRARLVLAEEDDRSPCREASRPALARSLAPGTRLDSPAG